jgi:hypothetical protein
MDSENYIELQGTFMMGDRVDEYAKKNFELIRSIMELEKELMQPETNLGSQRTELNCINKVSLMNIYVLTDL